MPEPAPARRGAQQHGNGLPSARPSCCRCRTSTWCSRCRTGSPPSLIRIEIFERGSTPRHRPAAFGRRPPMCLHDFPWPASETLRKTRTHLQPLHVRSRQLRTSRRTAVCCKPETLSVVCAMASSTASSCCRSASQGPSKNDIIPRAPARAPAAGPGIEPPVTGPPLTAPAAGPGPADTSGAPGYGVVRQAKGLLKMTLPPGLLLARRPPGRGSSRR
jgi:hypothetical protein